MKTENGYQPGDRVQLHPGTDQWMQGDRYGEVVKVQPSGAVLVKMDRSGRTLLCMPEHILGKV